MLHVGLWCGAFIPPHRGDDPAHPLCTYFRQPPRITLAPRRNTISRTWRACTAVVTHLSRKYKNTRVICARNIRNAIFSTPIPTRGVVFDNGTEGCFRTGFLRGVGSYGCVRVPERYLLSLPRVMLAWNIASDVRLKGTVCKKKKRTKKFARKGNRSVFDGGCVIILLSAWAQHLTLLLSYCYTIVVLDNESDRVASPPTDERFIFG